MENLDIVKTAVKAIDSKKGESDATRTSSHRPQSQVS